MCDFRRSFEIVRGIRAYAGKTDSAKQRDKNENDRNNGGILHQRLIHCASPSFFKVIFTIENYIMFSNKSQYRFFD